jgi:hypothetical protein
MGEVVWSVMAGASAMALLYGAWLVFTELVRNRGGQSAKTEVKVIALSTTTAVLSERRSGAERRSSRRQAAQRMAA